MNANLIIKASAGTGKTFAIATRYLQLLIFGKAKPEQILALTFSRAAAQEIYDKILERLWKAAASEEGATKEKDNLLESLPSGQRALAEAVAEWTPAFFAGLLRRIIAAQHHDTIATLDSFIQRIVRSFPLEMGFQKDVSVLDDYGKNKAIEKAAEEVLATTVDNEGIRGAFKTAQGNDAVRSGLSKVQAATKTWGEFLRELALNEEKKEGREQEREWTADSMRKALGIEADPQMPDLSSISVAKEEKKLLEDFKAYVAEFDETKDVFPDNAFGRMARFFCENNKASRYEYTLRNKNHVFDCGPEGAATIRSAVRWMAGRVLSRKIDVVAAKMSLAKAVENAYDTATRRKGLLTFADFTDFQAANENSTKGLALQNLQFRLDSRFDHWALDEFQDTSMPQWDCLRRLVEEALSGDERSVMAVGDFKQSIYAWRGGDDRPFRELIDKVSAAGAVESIDLSYRYQERTAHFVNAVFCPENVRAVTGGQCSKGVKIWEKDCWPKGGHRAKGTDDYVEIVGVVADAGDGGGESGKTGDDTGGDDNDDGDFKPSAAMRVLARSICDCVRDLWGKHEAAKSTETIGILVRNNADGLYLAERLRATEFKEGKTIPVVWEGQSGVLDSPIVRAVLELLWLAEHPEDKFSWAVVDIIFPLRKTVFREEEGWAATFPKSAKGPADVSEAVSKCLSKTGLARTLRAIVSALKAGDAQLDNRSLMRLDELVREGVNFEARPDADAGIAGFRRYLQSVTDREIAASPDVVRILTIHRSKGLSIDHVIVPVTENGSLLKPKSKRISGEGWALESLSEKLAIANEKTRAAWEEAANGHLLEELRTWYVALTRAKKSTRVFVLDGGLEGDQFRDLLLRSFTPPADRKCDYGSILHADGTPPSFGRKEGDELGQPPKWDHARSRSFVSHATPSTGGGVSHAAFARTATSLFDAKFDDSTKHGTNVHAAFAEIKWIDPDAPKDDRERQILAWDGKWRKAFVLPADTPVWREQSYELFDKETNTWETGQFDRVVFRGDGANRTAEIYDFKTNENREKTVKAFEEMMREKYAGQMAAYRSAVSRLTGIPESSITSTLLLTSTGTSVEA